MKKYFRFFLAFLFLLILKFFLWDPFCLRWYNPTRTAFMQYLHVDKKLNWTPPKKIPAYFFKAVVAAEDTRFFEHHGVDWEALQAAWKLNSKSGEYRRGGSTLTMQITKNVFLNPEKSLVRKALEIKLALILDVFVAKERQLEIYANIAEMGPKIFGIGAASQFYFKKNPEALTPYECAFLAAILPAPESWGHYPPGPYVRRRIHTIMARARR